MKFREVFREQFGHLLRSRSTWVYLAILLCISFSFSLDDAPATVLANANAPFRVALISLLVGMFSLPVSAAIFGDAAVRDVRAGMDPLVFTSPLRKVDYLGGRWLAALAINCMVLLAVPVGLALPVLIAGGGPTQLGPFILDPAAFGPFLAGAYVQPYLILLVPNLILVGAALFTTGVLTRQTIPVYLVAIGLFVGTMVSAVAAEGSVSAVVSVLGPLGFAALNELVEYWTVAEQNARLIGLPATLAWNRVVWLIASALLLGGLHWRFRFAHPDGGRRRRVKRQSTEQVPSERPGPLEVPRIPGTFGRWTGLRQTLAVARNAIGEIVFSRWFVVVIVACVGLTLLWGWNVAETVFDTSTWPVTLLVAGPVLSQRIVLLIYLLIILYAGELVWKGREVGVAEIADAAPVSGGVVIAGRFLALAVVLAMIQAATMAGGMLIQAFQGYYNFEIGQYVRVVFGLNLARYVLLAALAMSIHVIVNQKYLGHMLALLAIVFTRFAGALGIRHHLLVYDSNPGWTYSDMNGFGPYVSPFVWFESYWAAWALLLLGVIAVLFLARGPESGMRHRVRQARARFRGSVVRTAALAFTLIVLLGGFIFYNTNILNDYVTDDDAGASQAAYERRYRRFDAVLQPEIADAELRIEIYPDEPAVDLSGAFRLVNRTGAPIDSVHVFTVPDIRVDSIGFDRAASPAIVDDDVGYRIYALDRPLEPGDSLRLAFDVAFRPRGFPNSGIQTDVVANGAYFSRMWLPFIGYQPAFELSDPETRQHFGLAPQQPMPSPGDMPAEPFRRDIRDADRVHVDAIVGTASDQTAVMPARLRRSWTENGRRYFHYETGMPVSFGNAVFSARYAVLEDEWDGVALRIYHHATHDYDLDRMVRSMKASLDYYTASFGPYRNSLLSIVEVPRYATGGRAHPHTIAFAEDIFLNRVREGEVDQPFFGTAHEVAHQWWGGQVSGAPVRGRQFLSESLANYSAMLVVERTYGHEMARRVYDFQMDRYLRGRATQSAEVPLLEAADQPYIAYRKGAIALYTLREHIGEDPVNSALRAFLEKFRDAVGPDRPTSLDLYAELRAVTPDSLRYLLTDWFETITLWDVKAERAEVEPTGTGEYVVSIDVVARKMRADDLGNETEVPMDDLIEIGVFAPSEGGRPGEPISLARHRIHNGEQTIRIIVSREPARAGIDPRNELVDRRRNDNVVDVERAAAGSD